MDVRCVTDRRDAISHVLEDPFVIWVISPTVLREKAQSGSDRFSLAWDERRPGDG
jgi:hypothetical protein